MISTFLGKSIIGELIYAMTASIDCFDFGIDLTLVPLL